MFSLSRKKQNKTNSTSKSLIFLCLGPKWSRPLRVQGGGGLVTSRQRAYLRILGVVTSASAELLGCVSRLLVEPHCARNGGLRLWPHGQSFPLGSSKGHWLPVTQPPLWGLAVPSTAHLQPDLGSSLFSPSAQVNLRQLRIAKASCQTTSHHHACPDESPPEQLQPLPRGPEEHPGASEEGEFSRGQLSWIGEASWGGKSAFWLSLALHSTGHNVRQEGRDENPRRSKDTAQWLFVFESEAHSNGHTKPISTTGHELPQLTVHKMTEKSTGSIFTNFPASLEGQKKIYSPPLWGESFYLCSYFPSLHLL